jgi:hypothetical protein
VKDKCSLLDQFEPDQDVQVSFDIRGNEFNGKYFVNLSCWKIQAAGSGGGSSEDQSYSKPAPRNRAAAAQSSSSPEPSAADLRKDDDFDDDIPF